MADTEEWALADEFATREGAIAAVLEIAPPGSVVRIHNPGCPVVWEFDTCTCDPYVLHVPDATRTN